MNIYIPYSLSRDIFKGEELKFAIRSIEKYLTGWQEIVLIGTAPGWFTGRVIEAGDIEGRKEESIYKKMLLVNDAAFIRWDDDHFLLQPLDVTKIYNWHDGYLKDYRNGSARYQAAVGRTLDIDPDMLNYDIHAPMKFIRGLFNFMFSDMTGDICVKSYYRSLTPYDGRHMDDLKIGQWMPKEEIKNLIKGRLFFSTGTLFTPMIELLNELYPDKSKYEKS